MAVLAPITSAIVQMADAVNSQCVRSVRNAYVRSDGREVMSGLDDGKPSPVGPVALRARGSANVKWDECLDRFGSARGLDRDQIIVAAAATQRNVELIQALLECCDPE